MTVRASFPTTGKRAADHADAKTMAREADDDLAAVAAGKRAGGLVDPGRDASRENARKVKAEGWNATSGPTHTPSQ